ncbi:putative nucleotidyltransferase substrate binding domain-containing protein [Corynebacterium sputi]|uniref:putative nucleotidyltransferase substrate binding domain-containing protein n=1 Tax=Corynebacterium sputi TaxID=489915 RepID=UPI0003F65735|nr:putative nucleotidyltransferase substrate binding domain-containing protein [Corynebacterium sputi]
MQSTLTDLGRRALRRRAEGDTAEDVAAHWSEKIRALLDVSLAATGSVGRGEATPLSDVDVIRISAGATPKLQRLSELGKVDSNGVAGNSWALPEDATAWRVAAPRWADHPELDLAVVKIGLLADAADNVRSAAADVVPGSRMIAEMLRDSLATKTPKIGLHRWSHTSVAVKDQLLTPIVKLARWAALSSGSDALSTPARLASAAPFTISADESGDLAESFSIIFAVKMDLDLGLIDRECVDHRGRLILPALSRDRAKSVIASAATVRGIQNAAGYRLTTSSYAPGNIREPNL